MKPTSTVRSLIARHATKALVLGAAALIGAACGAGGDGNGSSEGSGANSGSGNAGSGGSTGSLMLTTGSAGGMSTSSGFQECATSSDEATLIPVNMIIMFDRSGSMQNNNKWTDSTNALQAFIEDPGTAGLRVALRFFPTEVDGCTGSDCDINDCSIPEVDSGALTSDPAPTDSQEQLLVSAINSESPDGFDTPISAALQGATNWASSYLATNPNERAVVILVTDGAPNGCQEGTNAIAGIAAQAYVDSGVLTYAVGLQGSNETLMNLIANQGGTNQGIFISAGANAEQELLTALQAIQGSQLACSFQMPEPAPGETIDPGKINVEYTPANGMPQTIPQVANAGGCTAAGGWYYDNPTAPTMINLCPDTCNAVQADAMGGSIRVVVGCETQVQ